MRAWLRWMGVALAASVGGCVPVVQSPSPIIVPPARPVARTEVPPPSHATAAAAARSFISVMRRMEPAIEEQCIARRRQPISCDFQFVVDDRAGLEPNAFQTVDAAGRPIIGFTLSLIAAAQNSDEIAFVVGHEASHHILGHLDRKTASAQAGAIILAGIATVSGGGAVAIETAQSIGAQLGARTYSKQWELEADYLGAIVTLAAGYDPVNGARFFMRIPDPGDHILGSHPSRAQRINQVSRAVADVKSGRAM